MLRRRFLQLIFRVTAGACATVLCAKKSLADWPEKHFSKGDFADSFQQLFGDRTIDYSEAIRLVLPEIAENGAVVPITISSDLADIQRLYIWVEKNPTPLAAEVTFDASLAVYLTARIKMAESCHVVVIAQQGEQLLRNQRWVKVMQGGCGTG
ncbi:thiosulfate oxidation carrier protein SoxY [Methylomonas methanica]|uniref:Twin-arginine translocation pathway signal n=1 Tax=Methylomonas methanica (strain DSM 25384 / MC09) TaxID=857087 RepID=F9ZV85_METMM|nr:thiosulfate oxidation carrier protein SoxY [Methylomonas methanica]AEG00695.1 twin-arginine translocation pathway signal [Methylomonas methanica MC09]